MAVSSLSIKPARDICQLTYSPGGSAASRRLTISTGIDFPHAPQATQSRRRRRRLDQPKRFTTETV